MSVIQRVLAAGALGFLGTIASVAAQTTSARVVLGGGSATDLRGVRSGAYVLAPSITLNPTPNFGISLGGRATRFTNDEWSLGGSAAAAFRVPMSAGFGLLLTGDGEAINTSYHATYWFAQGTPALEWRRGMLGVWAGARAATARTEVRLSTPPLPGPSSTTRSQIGPAFGGSLRFAGQNARTGEVLLSYREEHGRPGGVSVIDRTAGLGVSRGILAISGTLGFRHAPEEDRSFGGARLGLTLTPGVELIGAAESYPSNRLTGTVGGRSFTAAVSLSFGGPHPVRMLPKPAGAPALGSDLTRLSLSASDAAGVEVAGDWNGWHPVPLQRSNNGVWYADLAIPPGTWRYAFRVDGKTWQVPKGAAAVDDGFGGKSAWLTVKGAGRTATQSANRKEAP